MTAQRESILVTGASGFIGRALVAALAGQGRPVVAASRRPFDLPQGAKLLVTGGAEDDEAQVRRALSSTDVVVHAAGRAHRGGGLADFEPDIELGVRWARLSAEQGVRRFIQMSSIGVLGTRTFSNPFTEDTPPAPREPYAKVKLDTEQAIQRELASATTEWVILRPPMVYGPGAPGNFARLVHAVQRGWPLPFAAVSNRRNLVAIDNLVAAILRCAEHEQAARQVFLVADDEAISTAQLVTLIARGLGVPAHTLHVPPPWLDFAARAMGRTRMADSLLHDLRVDAGKIRQSLDWRPLTHADEAIVRAAAAAAARS
jgi:UDP-4-keto-D-FucNAc 4-reductase